MENDHCGIGAYDSGSNLITVRSSRQMDSDQQPKLHLKNAASFSPACAEGSSVVLRPRTGRMPHNAVMNLLMYKGNSSYQLAVDGICTAMWLFSLDAVMGSWQGHLLADKLMRLKFLQS